MNVTHQFLREPELILLVVHYLLESENPSIASTSSHSELRMTAFRPHHCSQQRQFPCSNLCPVCRRKGNVLICKDCCCYVTMVAQTPQHRPFQDEAYQRRRNLNALVQMVFVCRALFDIVAPILWRHLDLMTTVETHSGYEQKRLKRWLEAILQQESWNNHAYPFSQVRSPEAIATMALYAHVPAARIGVGAFVKVLQMTRSLWLGLDKRSLEKMKMAFPCIAILQVLDVAELGGVDSQELHDFLGDPLSAISSYKDRLETDSRVLSHESQEAATEGQVSQLCLLFDSLASPQKSTAARTLESSRPMLTSQSSLLLQNMVQWFSRLESLVLPERGLAISDADIDMNEGVDINVDLRRKKRTISDVETLEPCSATGESRYIIDIESEQVNIKYGHKKRIELADQVETQATRQEAISSIHPRLLRSHSPHNNNMECPNRFMSLAHVSCSFEPIGLLSLDLILNQLSMPCLTSVEIRARSSLLNSVLAQSQKMCFHVGIEGKGDNACQASPLIQSINLMRKALCHGCSRNLQQIDIPDIEEYELVVGGNTNYGCLSCLGTTDPDFQWTTVHRIIERHSSTLRRLSLWRDGLSREALMA